MCEEISQDQILHTDDTFTTFYMDQTAGTLELFFKINIESVIICISFLDLQNNKNQFNQNSPQCQYLGQASLHHTPIGPFDLG